VEDHSPETNLASDVDLPPDFMRFLIGFSSISSVIICEHKTGTEPKGYEEQKINYLPFGAQGHNNLLNIIKHDSETISI
jgi:hypothetical protein